jgi:RNA polymerase sigma factor (sigma-70 family)
VGEFDEIYFNYNRDISNFILKITNYDYVLTEELTQETFYRAYISITKFKGECNIKTWLCQIAKNCYFMHLRKNKKITFDNMLFENSVSNSKESYPHDIYEQKDIFSKVIQIINSMNENMRDVMIYRIFSEQPYMEIARMTGKSENSVKVMFYRGKVIIKERLKEEFGYEI